MVDPDPGVIGATEPNALRSPDPARRCLRCKHEECPCCVDWCDTLEHCKCSEDASCIYEQPRSEAQQAWIDSLPDAFTVTTDAEGHWIAELDEDAIFSDDAGASDEEEEEDAGEG